MGYHVDDVQMMPPVASQLMMSRGSHTNNHTNQSQDELHKMITQDEMMSCPRMEMMNDTFRCSRATQVHMEDLRLFNLTEICPSRKGE